MLAKYLIWKLENMSSLFLFDKKKISKREQQTPTASLTQLYPCSQQVSWLLPRTFIWRAVCVGELFKSAKEPINNSKFSSTFSNDFLIFCVSALIDSAPLFWEGWCCIVFDCSAGVCFCSTSTLLGANQQIPPLNNLWRQILCFRTHFGEFSATF